MARNAEKNSNGVEGQDHADAMTNVVEAMASDPIDQVRELLFGATKRETNGSIRAVEQRLEDVRNDLLDRISALEGRLVDLARDTEHSQAEAVNAIGGAISQLGASIQAMSTKRNR